MKGKLLTLASLLGLGCVVARQANDAVVPVPRPDVWWKTRHYAMVDRIRQGHARLLFVGDSITHAFGGEPVTGETFNDRGKPTWDKYYGHRQAVNLGISGDRTQHVIWRLDRYHLEASGAKVAVVMIGTNNMGANSPEQIAEGVAGVCGKLSEKAPGIKILLLAIFPKDKASSALRKKVTDTNVLLQAWATKHGVEYLDIGHVFVDASGEIPAEVMPDGLHPMAGGYASWAKAIEPTLAKLLGDRPVQ